MRGGDVSCGIFWVFEGRRVGEGRDGDCSVDMLGKRHIE